MTDIVAEKIQELFAESFAEAHGVSNEDALEVLTTVTEEREAFQSALDKFIMESQRAASARLIELRPEVNPEQLQGLIATVYIDTLSDLGEQVTEIRRDLDGHLGVQPEDVKSMLAEGTPDEIIDFVEGALKNAGNDHQGPSALSPGGYL